MTARKAGAVLGLIAIIPLLIAAFTRGWMTTAIEDTSSSFGLLSVEACQGERCQSETWSKIVSESGGAGRLEFVVYGGYAAVGGTLVLALLLGLASLRTFQQGKAGALAPLCVGGAVIGMGGALATLYMLDQWAARRSRLHIDPDWGYSANLFFLGAILVIVAAVLMMIRPPTESARQSG